MTTDPSSAEAPVVRPLPNDAYVRMTLVLRLGLGLSLALLGGGIVAYLWSNPGATSSSVLAQNPIGQYLSVSGLVSGLLAGSLGAFLTLGIVLLILTPVVRVLSGLYYFRKVGERAMTAITFTVFVLLLVGLFVIGPLLR